MTEKINIQQILEILRSKEPKAMQELMQKISPTIETYSKQICKHIQDAQDVAQESLLSAVQNIEKFKGDSAVGSWLFTITKNYCAKARRTSKFAPTKHENIDEKKENIASPNPTPETSLHNKQFDAALKKALDLLEPTQQEVFILRDIEGLSTKEVASKLKISELAVKSRLHRSRQTIEKNMHNWFIENSDKLKNKNIVNIITHKSETNNTKKQQTTKVQPKSEQNPRVPEINKSSTKASIIKPTNNKTSFQQRPQKSKQEE